jgi:hypothetical protein
MLSLVMCVHEAFLQCLRLGKSGYKVLLMKMRMNVKTKMMILTSDSSGATLPPQYVLHWSRVLHPQKGCLSCVRPILLLGVHPLRRLSLQTHTPGISVSVSPYRGASNLGGRGLSGLGICHNISA